MNPIQYQGHTLIVPFWNGTKLNKLHINTDVLNKMPSKEAQQTFIQQQFKKHTMTNNPTGISNSQAIFVQESRSNQFMVGSVHSDGSVSFATRPALHLNAASARAECKRLAKINPGKLYVFVMVGGGEFVPAEVNGFSY